MSTATRSARFDLRLTEPEREIILRAAEVGGETLSTFVRRMALTGARTVLKPHEKDLRAGG